MKRAFLIIIPIFLVLSLIVFWAVNSHIAYKAQMEAKEAHKQRIEENVISVVENLIKKYNAFDWVKDIKGRKDIFDPILTVELEQLWLTDRPTLFIGEIEDITTLDQESYILKILVRSFWGDFGLAIKSPMEKINSLLKEHPNLAKSPRGGVAVVANINNIKFVGGKDDIRIGEGEFVDIVYLEDAWSWYQLVMKN